MLLHIHKDEQWTFGKVFETFFCGDWAGGKENESWYDRFQSNNEIKEAVCTRPYVKFDFKFDNKEEPREKMWKATCRSVVRKFNFLYYLMWSLPTLLLRFTLYKFVLTKHEAVDSFVWQKKSRWKQSKKMNLCKEFSSKLFCHHLSTLINLPFCYDINGTKRKSWFE